MEHRPSTPIQAAMPVLKSLFAASRNLRGPWLAAFTPALCFVAYLAFGQNGLLAVAVTLPVLMLPSILRFSPTPASSVRPDPVTDLPVREAAVLRLDEEQAEGEGTERSVACLAIGIEEFDRLVSRFGDLALQRVLCEAADRLKTATRQWDVVVRLAGPRFGIALTRLRRADLEIIIEIASRIQRALSEPYTIDGNKAYLTISVGVCLPPIAPSLQGEGLVTGAERALDSAMAVTGGAIRRYSEDMRRRDLTRSTLRQDAHEALSDGRIRPWFQPQISTDTGKVTGVEVLARWEDENIGLISPGDFLPALEAEGLLERLGQVMLSRGLEALKDWDAAGLDVPTIGINVSEPELRDPKFCDKIRWELDRFEIPSSRLSIEVLETVTSEGADDVVARNLWALARLGCKIDLDDFGTGNASLSSIRRFGVHRLKIDRSYITDVDTDPEQQSMVAAIVTMAERLNLETLAEGVETLGEHAMVAQLGCLYVQGYVISQPMPLPSTTAWLLDQKANTLSDLHPDVAKGLARSKKGKSQNGKSA